MGAKKNSVWATYPYHVTKLGSDQYQAMHLETGEVGPVRESYREAETDAVTLRLGLLDGLPAALN